MWFYDMGPAQFNGMLGVYCCRRSRSAQYGDVANYRLFLPGRQFQAGFLNIAVLQLGGPYVQGWRAVIVKVVHLLTC